MGWTGEIRPHGQTWRSFFAGKLGAGRTIVACNTAKSLNETGQDVFYAAVRIAATGETYAFLALLDHSRASEYRGYVLWKDLSETGADRTDRGDICASAAVLDALSPTSDADAAEWRAAARARLELDAARPALRPGVTVRFPDRTIRFSDGAARDTFTLVRGNRVRTTDGHEVTLPAGWREWARELVAA